MKRILITRKKKHKKLSLLSYRERFPEKPVEESVSWDACFKGFGAMFKAVLGLRAAAGLMLYAVFPITGLLPAQ